MRTGRPRTLLMLTANERRRLESLAHRSQSAPHVARRARLILACAAGRATTSVAKRLFVDPISIQYLKNAEVDFVDTITGGGFTIKNPNAKSTCGCGSSFSTE